MKHVWHGFDGICERCGQDLTEATSEECSLSLSQLAEIVRGNRYRFADEYDLQDAIASALELRGVPYEREVRVAGGRLDFLVEGYAIEVKVTASAPTVFRQARRYIQGGDVEGVLVVAMTPKIGRLPEEIDGKPVEVVILAGGGL